MLKTKLKEARGYKLSEALAKIPDDVNQFSAIRENGFWVVNYPEENTDDVEVA